MLGGRTFLERVSEAAADAFDTVWYVSREPLRHVPAERQLLDAEELQRAAIFGLERAVGHAAGKFWLIGVDFPLVTGESLRLLRARFSEAAVSVLAPVWHGQPQMLCAGYTSELGSVVSEQVRRGDFRMQSLLDRVASELVPEAELRAVLDGEPLWNVNDREELEKVKRAHER